MTKKKWLYIRKTFSIILHFYERYLKIPPIIITIAHGNSYILPPWEFKVGITSLFQIEVFFRLKNCRYLFWRTLDYAGNVKQQQTQHENERQKSLLKKHHTTSQSEKFSNRWEICINKGCGKISRVYSLKKVGNYKEERCFDRTSV